jgi:hypothetical protein
MAGKDMHIVILNDHLFDSSTIRDANLQCTKAGVGLYVYTVSRKLFKVQADAVNMENNSYYAVPNCPSRVFAPRWEQSSQMFVPLHRLRSNDAVTLLIDSEDNTMTKQEFFGEGGDESIGVGEIDYEVHLTNTRNKFFTFSTSEEIKGKKYLTDVVNAMLKQMGKSTGKVKINIFPFVDFMRGEKMDSKSPAYQSQMNAIRHGVRHLRVFLAAKFHKLENHQVPGWALQCGSVWLQRFYDCYDVRANFSPVEGRMTEINGNQDLEADFEYDKDSVREGMLNPRIAHDPYTTSDNRFEAVISEQFRKVITEGTLRVLVNILRSNGLFKFTDKELSAGGGWYGDALWKAVSDAIDAE